MASSPRQSFRGMLRRKESVRQASKFKTIHDGTIKTKATSEIDIIFVHGLYSHDTENLEQTLVNRLNPILERFPEGRLYVFAYSASDLLQKGQTHLGDIAWRLVQDIQTVPDMKRITFIAHATAEWVVRDAITNPRSQPTFRYVPSIVEISVPVVKSESDWISYRDRTLRYFGYKPPKEKISKMLDPRNLHLGDIEYPALLGSYNERIPHLRIPIHEDVMNDNFNKVHRSNSGLSINNFYSTRSSARTELCFMDISDKDIEDVAVFLRRRCTQRPVEISATQLPQVLTLSRQISTSVSSIESRIDTPGMVLNIRLTDPSRSPTASISLDQQGQASENEHMNLSMEMLEQQLEYMDRRTNLAHSYLQTGQIDEATRLYTHLSNVLTCEGIIKRVERNVGHMDLSLAQIKYARGMFREAEKQLRPLLDHGPTVDASLALDIRHYLALSQLKQGKYQSAVNTLKDGHLNARPNLKNSSKYLSTYALALAYTGSLREAYAISTENTKQPHANIQNMLSEISLEAKQEVEGDHSEENKKHAALGFSLLNHARILSFMGRYKDASCINQDALKIHLICFGPRSFDTLDCVGLGTWLSVANIRSGDTGSAVQERLRDTEGTVQETLKSMREYLGEDHPLTLETMENLIKVYQAQGRLSDAEHTASFLLRRIKRHGNLGEYHPQTLKCMSLLSQVWVACGKLDKAESLAEEMVLKASTLIDSEYGTAFDHSSLPSFRTNLATILRTRGKWDLARDEALYEVLRQLQRFGLEDREHTTAAVTRVQHEDIDMGEIQFLLLKSKYVSSKLRNLPKEVPNPLNADCVVRIYPSLVQALHCLALCEQVRDDGDLKFAFNLLHRIHRIREQRLGAEHEYTLSTKVDLSINHRLRGQISTARSMIEPAQNWYEESLGKDHPEYLYARQLHAMVLCRVPELTRALRLQRVTLRAQQQLLGSHHPDTIQSQYVLAYIYQSLEEYDKAEPIFGEVIEKQRDLYNLGDTAEDHPVVLRTRVRHATTLQASPSRDKLRQARAIYEELQDSVANHLSHGHHLLFQIRSCLGSCYFELNMLNKAEDIQIVIVEELKKARYRNGNFVTSKFNLALTQKTMGKMAEATALLREAMKDAEDILGGDNPQAKELQLTLDEWQQ